MTKDRFDDDQLDAQATEYTPGDYPAGIGRGLHARALRKARASAVARFRAWVDGEHDERPTRSELRGDGALVLAELDRVTALAVERGSEIVSTEKGLADVQKNLVALTFEVDSLRAQRDQAIEERDGWFDEHATVNVALEELGRERDELKRRLVQAQRERDSFRVELVETKRIRDSWQSQAVTHLQAVTRLQERVETLADELRDTEDELKRARELLRLRGSGRLEVVTSTTWDEHDDGSVGVAGFRIRDRG